MVKITVDGRALYRELQQVEKKFRNKVLRQGMRSATKVIQKQTVANAKSMLTKHATGATAKAVKVRTVKKRKRGRIGFLVQIGAGAYKGRQFYASFVEYGHWIVRNKQKIVHVPATGFMAKAARTAKDQAVKTLFSHVKEALAA